MSPYSAAFLVFCFTASLARAAPVSDYDTYGHKDKGKFKVEYDTKISPKVEKITEFEDESLTKTREESKTKSQTEKAAVEKEKSDYYGGYGEHDYGYGEGYGVEEKPSKELESKLEHRKSVKFEKKFGKHREVSQEITHSPKLVKLAKPKKVDFYGGDYDYDYGYGGYGDEGYGYGDEGYGYGDYGDEDYGYEGYGDRKSHEYGRGKKGGAQKRSYGYGPRY